jgi:hypothetical protein
MSAPYPEPFRRKAIVLLRRSGREILKKAAVFFFAKDGGTR